MSAELSTRTRRILIVDDDARCRRLIRRIVDGGQDQFWEGADGAQALEIYQEHRPDLVITDIEMLPVDGFTATHRILEFDPSAVVVMVSQHHSPAIVAESKSLGAKRFIPKEDLISLIDLLDELLPQTL